MCHFKLLILTLCVEQGIYNYVRKKFLIGIFLSITTFSLKFLDMNKGYLKLNVLFVVFLFAFFLPQIVKWQYLIIKHTLRLFNFYFYKFPLVVDFCLSDLTRGGEEKLTQIVV